ncbi:MAG: hypothetical protein U0Y96_00775 [Candidatus Kapaibacterium sp.]|nr:hypothetical protein [Bacteroidota bacterium]
MKTVSLVPLLVGMFLTCTTTYLTAQNHTYVSAAAGIPELLSIGMRYQTVGINIGASVSTFPTATTNLSVMLDAMILFGAPQREAPYGRWYVRPGVAYLYDDGEYKTESYIYANGRVGYVLLLNNPVSLCFDAGVMVELQKTSVQKKPSSGWNFNFEFPVLPSIGVTVLYEL